MRREDLHVLALQESLLSKHQRPPVSYTHEAIMRSANDAGWSPGGSVMLIRDDVEYTLVAKEITDA